MGALDTTNNQMHHRLRIWFMPTVRTLTVSHVQSMANKRHRADQWAKSERFSQTTPPSTCCATLPFSRFSSVHSSFRFARAQAGFEASNPTEEGDARNFLAVLTAPTVDLWTQWYPNQNLKAMHTVRQTDISEHLGNSPLTDRSSSTIGPPMWQTCRSSTTRKILNDFLNMFTTLVCSLALKPFRRADRKEPPHWDATLLNFCPVAFTKSHLICQILGKPLLNDRTFKIGTHD